MKSKKIILSVILCFCTIFCFAQNLKIATIAPARSVWDNEAKRLAQEISKATGGRVKLQFMNATAMGGESGVIQKLNSIRPGQKAPIDGAIFTNIGVAELAPDISIMTTCVPFLFRDQEEVDEVYKAIEPKMQKELKKKGYMYLGAFSVGWAYFYTKKPVHTPEDLKNQKMSVGGLGLDSLGDSFKAAGFKTENVAAEKLLQSLKSPGGAEAIYTIPMYAYAGQYYKSLPYILNIPICPVLATFIINEKTWNSFSEADKKAIMVEVEKAKKRFVEEQKNADQEYLKLCEQGGCTIITPTKAEYDLMEKTLAKDAYVMTKTGLMDTAFYEELLSIIKKHRGEQ